MSKMLYIANQLPHGEMNSFQLFLVCNIRILLSSIVSRRTSRFLIYFTYLFTWPQATFHVKYQNAKLFPQIIQSSREIYHLCRFLRKLHHAEFEREINLFHNFGFRFLCTLAFPHLAKIPFSSLYVLSLVLPVISSATRN
jgi:hypothetical protein